MNKTLFAFLFVWFGTCSVLAQKTVDISFDMDDFFIAEHDGVALVSSKHPEWREAGDTCAPAFPYFPYRIVIPNEMKSVNYNVDFDKTMLFEGVRVLPNQEPLPYSAKTSDKGQKRFASISVTTPVYNSGTIDMSGVKYLFLKVTPFVYDEQTGTLCFVPRITVTFPDLPESKQGNSFRFEGDPVLSILSGRVVNPQDIATFYPQLRNVQTNPIEKYLIVTSQALSSSFTSLANWKKMKGLDVEIVTVENIYSQYTAPTREEKIKRCLYDKYLANGKMWVLLGGDTTVVPAKICNVVTTSGFLQETPVDQYYACYGGAFNWNADGNAHAGEPSDSVDLNQNVYLSRLPLRNSNDILAYTEKLKRYELGINSNSRILFAGKEVYSLINNMSDSHFLSEMIYTYYVSPYWNGEKYSLYDTGYNLPDGASYNISAANLSTEINRGYCIIHESSHGDWSRWRVGDESNYDSHYYSNRAINQTNPFPSVIVTSACHTNYFPLDTCLSVSFIRNENGGAIAYFGSSCEGYQYGGSIIPPYYEHLSNYGTAIAYSDLYDAYFLRNLLQGIPSDAPYSFGAVTAQTKLDLIEECSGYGNYRKLQLSISPMGEPEMQVFTPSLQAVGSVSISLSSGSLLVNTGLANSRVCVTSASDSGASYCSRGYGSVTTFQNVPDECIVCVTKPGYLPYIARVGSDMYIQNETMTANLDIMADNVNVGSQVTSGKPYGPVTIESGKTKIKATNNVTIQGEFEVKVGAEFEVFPGN